MPYKPDLSSHQVNSLIELPKFSPVAEGIPGEDAVAAYERDGVVCLQGAFSKFWVDMVSKGMTKAQEKREIESGTDPLRSFRVHHPGEPGHFFIDTFMWQHMEEFRRFTHEGPAADLAMHMTRSTSIIFYFDFILIKEPGTSAKTPWHYDEAYWPITGNQMCNCWMVVEPAPKETTLRFVRGSHKWSNNYRLMSFNPYEDYPKPPDDPPVPDWDIESVTEDLVYAPLEPGDCVIFHNRIHHSAPGNSLNSMPRRALATHWIGDDIRYNDKPHTIDPPDRADLRHGDRFECGLFPRVR